MPEYLKLNLKQLQNLTDTYGKTLQIYDEKLIINNINKIKKAFNNLNFNNYFAVKALPNLNILKIMIDNEFGLDCSSINEVKLALQCKCPIHKIIFTGNYTSIEDYEFIYDKNILINLDDYEILERTNKIPNKLSFRINLNTSINTENNTILGGSDSKFGISESDIIKSYKLALDKGVKNFGIHIMYSSNVLDYNYWINLCNKFNEIIAVLKNQLNIDIQFINFGGGVGIPYKFNIDKINIFKISEILKQNLKNINNNKILFECGRFITGPYGWLVTTCDSIKKTDNKIFYGLNACMSNLMRPGMYNSYHEIKILNESNEIEPYYANIVGKLCENNDWFAKNRKLDKKAEIGDLFIIYDTGAHSHSMGFQYNARLRCPELLIEKNNNIKCIRRAETYEDYISTIIF